MHVKEIIGQKMNNNFDYNEEKQERGNKMQSLKITGNNWHLCLFVKCTLTQHGGSSSLALEVLLHFLVALTICLWSLWLMNSRFHTIFVSAKSSHHWVRTVTILKLSLFLKSFKGLSTWTRLLSPSVLFHLLVCGIIYSQLWKNSTYRHNSFAYLHCTCFCTINDYL